MPGCAVITGAGSGIGRETAVQLAAAGWQVALIGRRPETLTETARLAGSGHPIAADVTVPGDVERAFAEAAGVLGRIDLLFNNAGLSAPGCPIDEMSLETWDAVIGVNLTGAMLCARAAFGQMRRQSPQGGRIINNGSISAYAPRPGTAPYTVSKHAITGLTRTLALDGRPFDIACGQIDIGNALTEMAMPMTKGVRQADGSIAVEATMDPVEVGRAVVHMASLPLGANVLFMTVMATKMPFVGRG